MIAWIGTIGSLLGAFLMAFGLALPAYAAFIVGSLSWLCVGLGSKDKALSTLNFFFLFANLIGLYRIL